MKWFLALFVALALAVSVFDTHDLFTWWLEVLPVFLLAPVLWLTRKAFPLSVLLSVLIALHCLVLIIGGHYTYAEAPPGYWLQEAFGFSRNHYDRMGHFMQGFVPALALREVLLRRAVVQSSHAWAGFFCVCFALAVSAVYEIFEMAVALMTGEAAESFLGTQGDVWDTQMDMSFAGLGALASVLLLSKWHDAQMKKDIKE